MTIEQKIDAARAAGNAAARAAAPRLPALHDDLLDLLAGMPADDRGEAIVTAWLEAYDLAAGLLQ